MAEKTRVGGPTRVSKGAYNPTQKMTPEQAKTLEEGGKATRAEQLKKRAKTVYEQRSRPKTDVRLRQVTPKKDLTAPTIGGLKQKTIGQRQRAQVDVKTGKPKPTKTYGERMIGAMERFGAKVAPPGSVTRLRETGARAPRTMSERLGSISRTASRTFPGKATRPGGILDIPALAAQTKGPSLKAQKETPAATKRRAAMSLAERKRKGLRVTGAHVPGTGEKAGTGAGIPGIKRTEPATEGHLGKFVSTRKPAPPPTPPRKRKAKVQAAPKKKWWERALEKVGELSAEATRDAAQYEERKAGKKKQVTKVKAALERRVPKPKRK